MILKILAGLAAVCLSLPAYAASDAECEAMWNDAMNLGLGAISDSEVARYLATMRSRNHETPADNKLTPDVFLNACKADVYALREADQGAPLMGVNSLSEGQVGDLAAAHGFMNIVNLKVAEDGIWRGRAMKNGESFRIAIDFKGNVVPQHLP